MTLSVLSHHVLIGVLLTCCVTPAVAGQAADLDDPNNGAARAAEAAERLNQAHVAHLSEINAYLHSPDRMPSPELTAVLDSTSRWMSQLRRAGRADFMEFPDLPASLVSGTGIPVSQLNVASEMLTVRAMISLRSGGSGGDLVTVSDLMRHLRASGSVSGSKAAMGMNDDIHRVLSQPALLEHCSSSTMFRLHERFEALPKGDPFSLGDEYRAEGDEMAQWVTEARGTTEGREMIRLFGDIHPSFKTINDMSDAEFAADVELGRAFHDKVAAAMELDFDESRKQLAEMEKEARDGAYGVFASAATEPLVYGSLVAMRERIEEAARLVDESAALLAAAMKRAPGLNNAAEFYFAAADIADETGDDEELSERATEEILHLIRRASACEWCDFSARKDMTSYIMPAYVPGLDRCVALLDETANELNEAANHAECDAVTIDMLRLSAHLAADARFGSTALAFSAFARSRPFWPADDAERSARVKRELESFDPADPFGYSRSTLPIRLAFRTRWMAEAPALNPGPDVEWTKFVEFTMSIEPATAWTGLFSLLNAEDRCAATERIVRFFPEATVVFDHDVLQARLAGVRALIEANDQRRLTGFSNEEFVLLFPSPETLTAMFAETIVGEVVNGP